METIRKHIGEGFGKGELYAALAYDATDAFGGLAIKQLRFNPESGKTAITIGDSTTAVTLATYAQRAITIYTTCASEAANNVLPFYINATMTGAGGQGRGMEVYLKIDSVELGAHCNAIKGYVDFNGDGAQVHGQASAICAEMRMPGAATTTGTYGVIELELICPEGWAGTNPAYFIDAQVSGNSTAIDVFENYGGLMRIRGLDSGPAKILYNDTLRIKLDATNKYIPLSTEEGTYTTAYPIVSSYAGTNGIEISGACTNGINITSTGSAFGLLYNVDMTTQIGTHVEGIKVILERTADIVVGTTAILGAEFVIKQGDDAYAAGMAPAITGVRIAMGGANTKASVTGLRVETQSNGYVDYLAYFNLNNACTMGAGGAILCLGADAAVPRALKIGAGAGDTITTGINFYTGASGVITNALDMYDGFGVAYFLKAHVSCGCIDTTVSGAADQSAGRIKINIGETTKYLYYYS